VFFIALPLRDVKDHSAVGSLEVSILAYRFNISERAEKQTSYMSSYMFSCVFLAVPGKRERTKRANSGQAINMKKCLKVG
jgi:hypothetical protein